jgi:hypothetical protein
LKITSKTWKKDTDDLFDFDTNEVEIKKMVLSKFNPKFFLVYTDEKLKLIDSPKELQEKYKEYLKKKKNSEIIINNDNNTSHNNSNEMINVNNLLNNNGILNNNNNNNNNNNQNNNNNNSNEVNSLNNNPFLIVSEFTYIPPYSFEIICPILSPYLRKNLKESYLCRSWRLCKKDEENLISIGDVIKLGRARLKIDTICIGEIFESCQINFINNSKKKNLNKLNKQKYEKYLINQKTNINKEKDIIENSKVSKISEMREEGVTYNPNINDINNNSGFSSQNPPSSKTSKPSCRICFLSYSNEENPLISPCKCNGSMKNIHYLCLKKCIETKIIKKTENNFKSYSWKSFSCEICKAEYPKYIKIKETLFSLVDLEINYSSYVTCDYTLYDDLKKKTFRKGIIIFKINDENDSDDVITVGRSQNNKIKLKDISVSRNHCNFVKKKNKLYIVDKGSKFGTLIYLNSPISLNSNTNECTLISGKHLFSVNLQRKQNFFAKLFPMCCYECGQVNPKSDVEVYDPKNSFDSGEGNNSINSNNNANYNGNDVIDELYQDYILDLGNDIYIHSEIESEKNIS